jgi:hypothetical protein
MDPHLIVVKMGWGKGSASRNKAKPMTQTSSLFERAVDRAGSILFLGLSVAAAVAVAVIAV